MQRVCVYCASSDGATEAFGEAARALAHALLERELGLVYGGANCELMGVLADTMLAGGGEVIGVIPKAFAHRVAHRGLSDLRVVESMHTRKPQGLPCIPSWAHVRISRISSRVP